MLVQLLLKNMICLFFSLIRNVKIYNHKSSFQNFFDIENSYFHLTF